MAAEKCDIAGDHIGYPSHGHHSAVDPGSMLDILNQDYIRTAYAKGLSQKQVIWRHALRNALNPVITAITGWFAELLAGAFFVEYIFGWKGIGKLTVDALAKLDFPVVMGSVLVTSFSLSL